MKMLWLRECCEDPRVGPKARRLGQALRLGLPVVDGLVVLPDEPLGTLLGPLQALPGERFAVRSAGAAEDLSGRSAAGIFLSRTDVPRSEVIAAVQAVRDSGQSPAVLAYAGAAVPMAVLIQPMVKAARLGVLYLDRQSGHSVCEERPAAAPEWANVSSRAIAAEDESALLIGARRLAALLDSEPESGGQPSAAYIEYALLTDGSVRFLQVRPAPPSPFPSGPDFHANTDGLIFVHDQEHNPDPLSRAQIGLVEGVADLAPALQQRVFGGYLYYAASPGSAAAVDVSPTVGLAEHYARDIAPACESLLQPLERYITAADGALDPRLAEDPSRCELPLRDALTAYRGVYRIYVAQLSPALRRARQRLDGLLREHLGEALADPRYGHGVLLAAAAAAPTERLQALFEIGRAAASAQSTLLRRYLAHYGAFASSWDIAAPCDDERLEWLLHTAQRLSCGPEPRQQRVTAEANYQMALAQLSTRLGDSAQAALQSLLPEARSAQQIAEEDDGLFFRAQRLCRWALLRRGALLVQAGRMASVESVFDLPWALHSAALDDFSPTTFAPQVALRELAQLGERQRETARTIVPPSQLSGDPPLWTPPATEVLHGCGVRGAAPGPVRGRARVIKTLFPAAPLSQVAPDAILVLPALLPSWAAELWQARALVTDSGGALSHGAILARERGVPAVLGTRSATRTIRDGQELWVDAERGRVYLLP